MSERRPAGADGGPRGPRTLASCGALLGLLLLLAPAARAQSLNGYVEILPTRVDETNEVYPFPASTTQTRSWLGRLSFTYQQQLWPNISLQVGGLFEQQHGRAEVADIATSGTLARLLPYVTLTWQTPTNIAEIGWQRNESRASSGGGPTRSLVRDAYGISLGWYPEPASFVRVSYFRTDDRDDQRQLLDQQTDRFLVNANYRPIDPLTLNYRGSWNWLDDQLRETEIDSFNQAARVLYGDSYWGGRLSLAASYDVSVRQVESRAQGQGEIELPVIAIRGLSALSDLPANVTLTPNPALIDGNREAAAGINLGLPPASDDRRLRNIGLDFEIPRAVSSFRVWVDRDLPIEISRTFTWEVWSSSDNVRWTRQRTLGSAPFAPFEHYFELRFAAIAARYLKVVVAPLAAGAPNAQDYRVIEVTELEALLFREVTGNSVESSSTDQRIYAGAQVLLLEKPSLTYDLTYVANIPDGRLASDTLSNILSLAYRFNPAWIVNGRVGYETGRSVYGRRTATLWGAAATATPIPTFSATLTASGSRERYQYGLDQDNKSLFLNATANLYTGINLQFGGGLAQTDFLPGTARNGQLLPGSTVDSQTGRVALELLPNPTLSVFLGYDRTRNDQKGGIADAGNTFLDASEISLSWTPVPSIYFFGSYRIEKSSEVPEPRRLTTTSLNWSPFPLGTLRLSLRYEEFSDTLLQSQSRIYGPGVRWYFNPISYLEVYWESFETESILQRFDRETLAATLRVGF